MADPFRCGDHVVHRPSGETWVVAYHDPTTGDLSPAGWPACMVRADTCTLARRASDEEHREMVAEWARSRDGWRAARVARLYGGVACP